MRSKEQRTASGNLSLLKWKPLEKFCRRPPGWTRTCKDLRLLLLIEILAVKYVLI